MEGFDLLGAELPPKQMTWTRGILAVAAGAVAATLVPKHPFLAALGAASIASNAHAVAKGERTAKQALRRMGRHVIATAGSLALPKYPAIGWGAGFISSGFILDEEDSLLAEWSASEKSEKKKDDSIIDAEFTEKPDTKALVKK